MKKDPVVYAMKFLIKNYYNWQDKFFDVLKMTIKVTCGLDSMVHASVKENESIDYHEYREAVLHSPYLLIRFIASFFLENDEDIINENHKVGKSEYQRMILIGEKLELDHIPVFQMFCKTFQ